MVNVKEKKVITYLVIILMLFLYISLFFIHDIEPLAVPMSAPQYSDDDENEQSDDTEVESQYVNNDINDDQGINNDTNNRGLNNTSPNNIFRVFSTQTSEDWSETKEIEVFKNKYFNNASIIAPGVSGKYDFTVENDNNFDINYSLKFTEVNSYNVNMVYRLKLDGKYVAGNQDTWVKCDDLTLDKTYLKDYSKNNYSLEWKWQDSNNDTKIGRTQGANYILKIQVVGTEVTE